MSERLAPDARLDDGLLDVTLLRRLSRRRLLRLFPTIYRHDPVYFSRFKLNRSRVRDMPRLSAWLERMLAWPGVSQASDLDHARNGYFGRTGNEVVPYGPVPLTLSPADYARDVWLNR